MREQMTPRLLDALVSILRTDSLAKHTLAGSLWKDSVPV